MPKTLQICAQFILINICFSMYSHSVFHKIVPFLSRLLACYTKKNIQPLPAGSKDGLFTFCPSTNVHERTQTYAGKRKNSKPTLTTISEESILLTISLKCIEEEFQVSLNFSFKLNSERFLLLQITEETFLQHKEVVSFSKIYVFEEIMKCTDLALFSAMV